MAKEAGFHEGLFTWHGTRDPSTIYGAFTGICGF